MDPDIWMAFEYLIYIQTRRSHTDGEENKKSIVLNKYGIQEIKHDSR